MGSATMHVLLRLVVGIAVVSPDLVTIDDEVVAVLLAVDAAANYDDRLEHTEKRTLG
jgi:uncharacterized protein YlxP (DUF503 family)